MKKKELPEEKHFYSIGEVASYLNVNESTLRFWEKEFTQLSPKRYSGERKYTKEDIEVAEKIYHLLKVEKLTIKGAKEYLKKKRKNSPVAKNYELYEQLKDLKEKLNTLKKIIEENA